MIWITCGPIGCGKSTWARKRVQEFGGVIADNDAIVAGLGTYDKPIADAMRDTLIRMALISNRDVIIDHTNHRLDTRQRWIATARQYAVDISLVAFDWPQPEISARRRFEADARGRSLDDWIRVARIHREELQLVTTKESLEYLEVIRA